MDKTMMNTEQRILEELVYERVRSCVNLCQLVIFERDLETGVRRALGAGDQAGDERRALTRRYMDEAWLRLETEWRDMRERFGDADPDPDPE